MALLEGLDPSFDSFTVLFCVFVESMEDSQGEIKFIAEVNGFVEPLNADIGSIEAEDGCICVFWGIFNLQ